MDGGFIVCPDALLTRRDDVWLLSNPRTRTHVELDPAAVAAVFRTTAARSEAEWGEALAEGGGRDRTWFSGENGLWSDPTGVAPRAEGPAAAGPDLLALLRRRWLVHADGGADYAAHLAPLTSMLDRSHLGNFHELVGRHLGLKLRLTDKWRWWHDQKYTADGRALKDGPYKFVQERFFDRHFTPTATAGLRVLDFGCGNGYYAAKFARLGASPVGIDTCRELIDLAEANWGEHIRFLCPRNTDEAIVLMSNMPRGETDLVYMSDVMLFFVENARRGKDDGEFARLLAAFHDLLSPNGRLMMMEPNAVFWLGGIYGGPTTPYTIVPEYRRPVYNGVPTPDHMVNFIARHGFALKELVHPDGEDRDAGADPWLHARAAAFPLWDLFTFVKHSQA